METQERPIRILQLPSGFCPFLDWLHKLNPTDRARIVRRIGRLRLGNFGDWKTVGKHLFELRLHFGPGFRVYFTQINKEGVILINGGIKESQKKDIKYAQKIWSELKDEIEKFQRDFN